MEINVSQLVWSLINFLVLFILLRKFFWKQIIGIMESREREIAHNLEHAENAREEAVRMKEEYERRLAEAQSRAEEIIAKASRKAEDLANEIREKAQAEAAAMLQRAQEAIEREKEKALAELRDEVADMALLVAGKVLERSVTDEDNERLARKFLAEVGELR